MVTKLDRLKAQAFALAGWCRHLQRMAAEPGLRRQLRKEGWLLGAPVEHLVVGAEQGGHRAHERLVDGMVREACRWAVNRHRANRPFPTWGVTWCR